MVIFSSVPTLILLAVSAGLALWGRLAAQGHTLAWLSVCCASVLVLLILMEGGTLYEGLLCLLLPAWLLMKEPSP